MRATECRILHYNRSIEQIIIKKDDVKNIYLNKDKKYRKEYRFEIM